MRHRSPTNSRPANDKHYRDWYREQSSVDELLPYFPPDGCGKVRVPGYDNPLAMHDTPFADIHHCWGGRCGRWDKVWNLVAVCRPVHEFCERYKCDGRVIVIRQKLDNGLWDEADAYRCLGMYPLGWIQHQTCEHQFAEAIRAEIVRDLKSKGAV